MDSTLRQLALSRRGCVSAAQARHLGIHNRELRRLVASGDLTRIRPTAYVLTDSLDGLSERARYALSAASICNARPLVAASHMYGLAIHDLPLIDEDLGHFDVVAKVKRASTDGCLTTHPLPRNESLLLVEGTRVCQPTTCVIQVAARHGLRPALVAADAALHRAVMTPEDLQATAQRLDPRYGVATVAKLLQLADPACESPGESLTRLILHGSGWPFVAQQTIRDQGAIVGRVDFLVGRWIIVEFDGAVKYEGSEGRSALMAEKRREDRLRALGYEVVRVTWADVHRPDRLLELIRQAAFRLHARGANQWGRSA